ncbi:MAG: glycosyltransferase [Chloroflexi bacterium]|nr:glycosyltransferase [Chloroflexota bacterium]
MKIALAAPTHLPARRANTVQVMKMAQALTVLGHEVRLAAPQRPDQPVSWNELARHYGLHSPFSVEWLPAHPALRRYDYGLRVLAWARRWQADLLYTRLPQAAALGSLLGLPTLFEAHDLPQGRMSVWLLRAFLRGRGARRLAAITRALADDLAALGAPPPFTQVAPDGVDLERYQDLPSPEEARRRLGGRLRPERFTAGYTGHLYTGRGAELILRLAARLPQMDFLLAGGEAADIAHFQAQAQGLENVFFAGFVPNADLPRYQAACEALLMPYQFRVAASSGGDISRYLSPMKLFEYLACGRAIVSSDLPVFREALHDGNALLLPADDLDAWTSALRALQGDPALRRRLSEQAQRDAQKYTWEARAVRLLEGLEL